MSDTIKRYQQEIAAKKQLITAKESKLQDFQNEYKKAEENKELYKDAYQQAKLKITSASQRSQLEQLDAAYHNYVKRLMELNNQISKLQGEINTLRNEISSLQDKIDKEMAQVYIMDVVSHTKVTKSYSFKVKDYDPISSNDELARANIDIKFLHINFKPANKSFWLPKYVDITGGYHESVSIARKEVRIDVAGDTNKTIKATIYISMEICGTPRSEETSVNIGYEKSTELKGIVKAGDQTKGSKINLGYSKGWTNNFNGGKETCVFELEYDCMASKPKISKKKITFPTYNDLKKVSAPASGWVDNFLGTEGNYDLMIDNKVDSL